LPSTFIAVGALDLFLEEDVAYALRLSRAGVSVETHVYPGGIHGFDLVPCEVASQYRTDLASAIDRMLVAEARDQGRLSRDVVKGSHNLPGYHLTGGTIPVVDA
jgi:acetyl esterase